MTRDELIELFTHAEVVSVAITGSHDRPDLVESITLRFTWLGKRESRMIRLRSEPDTEGRGWIAIDEYPA